MIDLTEKLIMKLPKDKQEKYLLQLAEKKKEIQENINDKSESNFALNLVLALKALMKNPPLSHADLKDCELDVHPQYLNKDRLNKSLLDLSETIQKLQDQKTKKDIKDLSLEMAERILNLEEKVNNIRFDLTDNQKKCIILLNEEILKIKETTRKNVELNDSNTITISKSILKLKDSLDNYVTRSELPDEIILKGGVGIIVTKEKGKKKTTYTIDEKTDNPKGKMLLMNSNAITRHNELTNLEYNNSGHSGFEPSLPTIPENPATKFLNGDREWKPISIGAGGFAGNLYFTNIDSSVTGYKQISYANDAVEVELSGTLTNQEALLRTYLFENPIATDIIDAGVWVANYRVKVSGTQGVTQLKMEVFLYHTDTTETVLWSSYSPEIQNTDYETIRGESNQPTFACATTDRLGVRIYGKVTANNAITINTIIGNENASYFTTPLRIRHNQLRDLNGDTAFQHITATDRTNIDTITGKLNLDQTTPQHIINGKPFFDSGLNLSANSYIEYNTGTTSIDFIIT